MMPDDLAPSHVGNLSGSPEELWYTRCPVPTVSGLALTFGWLQNSFADRGINLRSIRASPDLAVRESHYRHSIPTMFREGGNVPPLWARSNGEDTALIGITWIDEEQVIRVGPDARFRSPADLRGARLGVPRHNTRHVDIARAQDLRGLLTALEIAGLAEDDVSLVDVQGGEFDLREKTEAVSARQYPVVEALLAGKVDAIYAKGAVSATLMRTYGLKPLLDINRSPDPMRRVNAGTPRPITVGRALAIEQPDIAAQYLAVLIRTAEWATANPDAVVDAVAAETASDPQQIRSAYGPHLHEQFQPRLDNVAVEGLERQCAFLGDRGFIPEKFSVRDWVVAEPLRRARYLVDSGLVPPVKRVEPGPQ